MRLTRDALKGCCVAFDSDTSNVGLPMNKQTNKKNSPCLHYYFMKTKGEQTDTEMDVSHFISTQDKAE